MRCNVRLTMFRTLVPICNASVCWNKIFLIAQIKALLKMNTKYALHAAFAKPVIPVSEICQGFFNCKVQTANERIRAGTFPIPAFRLTGKNSGDFFVKVDDLADYIDEMHSKAKEEWMLNKC